MFLRQANNRALESLAIGQYMEDFRVDLDDIYRLIGRLDQADEVVVDLLIGERGVLGGRQCCSP